MAFVTVIPKQPRPAGTHRSNWVPLLPGTTRVSLRALMNNPDIQDSTLEMSFRIDGSNDGGVTSYQLQGNTWHGGFPNRDGSFSPPEASVQTTPMPTSIGAQVTLPRSLNIGLEVEVV